MTAASGRFGGGIRQFRHQCLDGVREAEDVPDEDVDVDDVENCSLLLVNASRSPASCAICSGTTNPSDVIRRERGSFGERT
ncbi:hypothetical protein W59_18589 [Rhodococcus opacus RKJ300 = JCM 13270]|uniref:Uncharacterized protein n=1 Tax=Rhodococcus opacus RKJ300 = JCM 13270 TaxID=1165867 RepID=I0WQD2_RHOOP|nr:hypothetical protein W59_18589 [Rhodococcus opacus RKJ300 = JCM 13270]